MKQNKFKNLHKKSFYTECCDCDKDILKCWHLRQQEMCRSSTRTHRVWEKTNYVATSQNTFDLWCWQSNFAFSIWSHKTGKRVRAVTLCYIESGNSVFQSTAFTSRTVWIMYKSKREEKKKREKTYKNLWFHFMSSFVFFLFFWIFPNVKLIFRWSWWYFMRNDHSKLFFSLAYYVRNLVRYWNGKNLIKSEWFD